ncbi:MAG TPA: hypothetical protein VM509_13750, partial [Planctomycetota bacterium]|nr:hypothetical protein [Planctomycetota bacterium]
GAQIYAPPLPPGMSYVQLKEGLLVRSDGQLIAFGPTPAGGIGPPLPPGTKYVEVAFENGVCHARRSDGVVVGWIVGTQSSWTAPSPPPGLSYCAIATGFNYGLGLMSDGTVMRWGTNGVAQAPPFSSGTRFLAIACQSGQAIGLRADGLLEVPAQTAYTPPSLLPPPPGMKYVAIASSRHEIMAVYSALESPTIYCTAKLNSLGCTPSLSYEGIASASSGFGFDVIGSQIRNQTPGLLLYSLNGQQAAPFQNGTLCIRFPISITTGVFAWGRPRPVNDCSGMYTLDMNAFASGALGGAPVPALRIPGTRVNCQYWGRDPSFAAPNDSTLTNALEYVLGV